MDEDKRLVELETKVDKIEQHLVRQTVPHINGLFAQVRELQRQLEALQNKK